MNRTFSTPLILLWTYTGTDKVIRLESSRKAFHNQTLPAELAEVLTYLVPIAELLIALLLLFSVIDPGNFQVNPHPESPAESEREL